ncbi:hypothetical protein WJX72_005018 [[Myrmecia] bisecta]|uniref:PHD finger protein n=1 Tax=[Myrmecia] bisecta TaxID=41462 RepID=A0AAW1PTQ4_9CHLO
MEGYFRDLTQEDVLGVLPRYSSLLDDPVLLVPPLGPEQAAGAATAATPATAAEEADKLAGRKSRRIVARVSKEAEARRIAEEEAAAAAEAQAALAGLTPSGQQANSLLETCTDDELALLADQVVGLRQITHSHEPLSENDPDLQRWLMIGRSSDQNGSNGGLQHISPDMRSKAHVWLRHVAQRAQQAQQGRSTALSQDQPAQQDDLEILERQVSSAGAGPSSGGRPAIARQRSSINYSLLAGKKDGARASGLGKAHRKAAKSGGVALCGEQQRPGHSQASSAVAAAVAAGPVEQGPEEQWQQLQDSAALLAAAPDDEILGEILALQSELMQQSAINRGRLEGVLQRAMEDRQRQAAFAEERADAADFVKAYIQRCRAAKRNAKREKREQAQREALAAMSTATPPSPRNATGRARSNALDASQTPADSFSSQQVSGEAFPLQDMLADRSEEEEAMCCVCGGGHSASPNYIVFCERCDIAVHQKCYDLDEIPAGEWLCWPCRRYEDDLRRQGVPQSQIRPPRWEMAGAGGRQLPEGGSRSVQCALCPVAYGAFRQTVDSQEWVHQVCALWQPEVTVRSANACEVVGGKANIKPDRWTDLCSICRRPYGAIIRCNLGHCAAAFHPLCARNAGQYLAVREVVSKATYRAYCSLHSELQRAKDRINLPVGEGVVLTKKDAKKREKEAQARFAELVALTGRESERAVLRSVRLELEALRLLLERMNRREKLKREAARLMRDVHALRLANPAEARALAATRQSEAEVGAAAEKLQVERECMMTSGEAAASNAQLPPGFMYVPANTLGNGSVPPA